MGVPNIQVLMEHCDQSLIGIMKQRFTSKFTEEEVLSIFHNVVQAVCYLHSLTPPVAHRDLKADNVLLGADRRYKLCDFGSCTSEAYEPQGTREINLFQDEIDRNTTLEYRADRR
uniref:non-specific serine/threonine protein kinase n=2 Tax=Eutreptiella gymnastica TaxID=73025 RepID=A0A7S1IEG7_9EUGL|mmetsp:Transcript_150278/g.262604  ORF Transcript_150278/g.262604 Transcript_150278/m.262604 type:complete len:115 (+) Transcript_150278:79-423(+)